MILTQTQPKTENSEMLAYLQWVDGISRHLSIESIVLKHGQFYTPALLPAKFERGVHRQCFRNAYLLSTQNDHLTYVEGFAMSFIPIHHAWTVDWDGNVVDNTWDEPGSAYYGIPFGLDFMNRVLLEVQTWGILKPQSKVFQAAFGDMS